MRDCVKYHDDVAGVWNTKYTKRSFQSRTRMIQTLLKGRRLSGQVWLDAGCGTGTLSCLLAEMGGMVFGVDASTSMIGQARTLWSSWADRLAFDTVETIERLPFEEGRFDGVLCSSVLEYLDDPIACCRELHRVLKPGGLLLFSVPNQRSLIRKAEKTVLHMSQRLLSSAMPRYLVFSKNEYSLLHLNQLLGECGFRPHRHGFCGLPPCGPIGQSGWIAPLLFVLAEKRPYATGGGRAAE